MFRPISKDELDNMRKNPFGNAKIEKLVPIIQDVALSSPMDSGTDTTPHANFSEKVTIYKSSALANKPPTATTTAHKKYVPPSQKKEGNWEDTTNSFKISNIPDFTTEEELSAIIRRFGFVKRIKLLKGGIAYVTMSTHKQTIEAVLNLDKSRISNMVIDAELAQTLAKKAR